DRSTYRGDRNNDRGPSRDFGDRPPRGESKPWQKREEGFERPVRRDRGRNFDRPKFDKPRDRDRDRAGGERPRYSREDRPRFDRKREGREDRPKFDRPRRDDRRDRPEGRMDWQEHPRSEGRFSDRPRR